MLEGVTVSWLGIAVVIMSFIQVTPIKINPWTYILKKICEGVNGELIVKVERIEENVKNVESNLSKQVAVSCRSRILVFGDEVTNGVRHSKEHFQHILNDITLYEKYCRENPDFLNNMTKLTAERIKETYTECMKKNTFL